MLRWLCLLLCSASIAAAQEQLTGYDAMKLVGKQLDRSALRRMIAVTGTDGDPQPTRWSILLSDRDAPGGVREIQVARGRIVKNGAAESATGGHAHGATIETGKLMLDSSGAFKVASYTADRSHINFSTVAYTLRTNERGIPVWAVTLLDDNRSPLGTIVINANKGTVTRVEGLYRGANMAQGEPQTAPEPPRTRAQEPTYTAPEDEYAEGTGEEEEEPESDNPVKREIKRAFRQARDEVKQIFQRVQRSFTDFFNRD